MLNPDQVFSLTQWTDDITGCLPCCTLDCHSPDLLTDDFLCMEKEMGNSEEIIDLTMTEMTADKNEIYINLMNLSVPKENQKFISDENCIKSSDTFVIEKSLISENDPEHLKNESDNSLHNDISKNCEEVQSSSLAKAFATSILDISDNIESFTDLSAFLNQEVPALSTITSENTHYDTGTSSTSHADITNSECTDTHESFSQFQQISKSSSEISLSSDNEYYEPKRKVSKLNNSSLDIKDKRYYEMRRKNNFASRRSRMTKKQREKEMEEKAVELVKENNTLKSQADKLEKIINVLKQKLFEIVKKK